MLGPLVIALSLAVAQAPPRDPVPQRTASGVIRGRVIDATTARPLRRATVSLGGPGGDSISTNSQGVFEFRNLPPGSYSLHARRDSYHEAQYGQRHYLESGRAIELGAGQRVDGVTIRMLRLSAIVGTITDDVGDPIGGVEVMPMQLRYFDGARRLVLAGGDHGRTDTTGYFRIAGLPPGDYYLLATTRQTWTIEENGGRHELAFAPTYYPGVTTPAEIHRIKVAPGRDVTNITFALVPGRRAEIAGTALDSRGTPLTGAVVNVWQEFRGPARAVGMGGGAGPVLSDGSFVIKDVPPGDYILRVTGIQGAERSRERSRVRISITGADVYGVLVTTSPPVTASGRVEADAGTLDAVKGGVIVPISAGDDDREVHPAPGSGRIHEDGTFSVGPLFGRYRFTARLPDGWALSAVMHGGEDVSIRPVEAYGPHPLTGLRVALSSGAASVTGRLAGEDGKPGEGTVLLFSTNRDHWFEHSRFVRSVRGDQHGRFRIRGLLPGEYYAVALDFVQEGAWHDPEFLESLTSAADRVMLGEREEKDLTLTMRR